MLFLTRQMDFDGGRGKTPEHGPAGDGFLVQIEFPRFP